MFLWPARRRSNSASPGWGRGWMNARGVYGRLRRALLTGGVVSRWCSGISRRAIAVGLMELKKKPDRSRGTRLPIRQKGGGRKKASLKDPSLLLDLEKLPEPVTGGDPQSPDHGQR